MKIIDIPLQLALSKIGIQRLERFIVWLARFVGIDLLLACYHSRGIQNYQNMTVTGEHHLIQNVLSLLVKTPTPVFLDVGANVGLFSLPLREQFPRATILAFEPIPETFAQLQLNTEGKSIRLNPFGLGDIPGKHIMYFKSNDPTSPQATLHASALAAPRQNEQITSVTVTIKTLEDVCRESNIDFIDLLKIDTEGHEMSVLKGAANLIHNDKIGAILFEIASMNIASRTFLKDFYEFLDGYHFYRLAPDYLIPLGVYNHRNEIFEFQNIFAMNPRIHPKLILKAVPGPF